VSLGIKTASVPATIVLSASGVGVTDLAAWQAVKTIPITMINMGNFFVNDGA